jgi:hypothetical protein
VLAGLKAFLAPEQRAAPTRSLADPWTALLLGGAGPSAAGVHVTPETAMRCAPVAATVRVLAETVSQLPVHLFRRLADGGRERADGHPVETVLADAANPWTPASEFRLLMQTHLSIASAAKRSASRRSACAWRSAASWTSAASPSPPRWARRSACRCWRRRSC